MVTSQFVASDIPIYVRIHAHVHTIQTAFGFDAVVLP